ncbi:MAG: PaaI family thioesterase [Pseudomonadota bacterium]
MALEDEFEALSGVERALGYRRTFWSPEEARIELELDERHMNLAGRVHGGIYAALLDDAAGYAVCWDGPESRGRPGVTLSLTVSYVGAPGTRRIVATGRRTGGGKSTSFVRAEARDADGALLATAEVVYKHFAERG